MFKLLCKGVMFLLMGGACLALVSGCTSAQNEGAGDAIGLHGERYSPTYTVSAMAQEDIDALNLAANKAMKFCKRTGAAVELLEHKTVFLGMGGREKNITHTANKFFAKGYPTKSSRDYSVTIKFHCH
jgi:hypothetical protein